ncbi:MAG: hypothetical protein M1812_003857 [Candelaria pacifica]|nr:MAG: hypothetical protein M1812_003857 [Candelaria pacifica]
MAGEYHVDMGSLQEAAGILHLLSHRNRNQHRVSKWWRWFSMLRRSVGKFLCELHSSDGKRSIARLEYMREILIPKCHLAFSSVVADNQFSALGLVLLSSLARISKLIGSGRQVHTAKQPDPVNGSGLIADPLTSRGQDLGEVVSRDASPRGNGPPAVAGSTATLVREGIPTSGTELQEPGCLHYVRDKNNQLVLEQKIVPTTRHKPTRNKRRRQPQGRSVNAIDALFEGLL